MVESFEVIELVILVRLVRSDSKLNKAKNGHIELAKLVDMTLRVKEIIKVIAI